LLQQQEQRKHINSSSLQQWALCT